MDIETLAMALALSKSKGSSSGGTDENLQNAIQALADSICPNRYTSGSNPEIQSGDFFYIDDDMYLRYSNDLIPANSSREDIDNSSRLVTSNGGLSDAINFLLHNSQHNGDALWDLFDDICPNRYMSGSNPEIEPNQFFYLDENMHLRCSNDLIPANSSKNDIDNLSTLVTDDGGLSNTISSLLANAQSGDEDEKKSSITLYNSNKNAITSVISIGTKSGSLQTGSGTTASGECSHAEGNVTKATGDASHAEGVDTTASGSYSHAEGGGTTASGIQSHAEGGGTTASGVQSHAEGGGTTASGVQSHAEGNDTTASGDRSHAEGNGTKANHASQHVFGEYNIEDPSTATAKKRGTYVEIIGNGTKSSARSNARTLDWSGNEVLAGNISAEGGSLTLGFGANAVTITAAQLQQLLDMLQS